MDKYALRYLPLFYDDFSEIVDYISKELKNPQAALELIDLVEEAITKRRENAEAFGSFHTKRERRYPYYRINVKNFTVFYVIIDDQGPQKIMEVRRILYSMRNLEKLL